MPFKLSPDRRNITDADILNDMQRVAQIIGRCTLRQADYKEHGAYGVTTAIRRFGSWASAVDKANLKKSVDRVIHDEALVENLLHIWTTLGKQPSYSDIEKPLTRFHVSTYERRFGSWRLALEAFVAWANEESVDMPVQSVRPSSARKRTPRQPDLRLRFRVLNRDRFTCRACGLSPALKIGVELNVDHKKPWSEGGETTEENLQTLCSSCNQGKSNCVQLS